jgi:hypothetical protein
MRSRGNMYMQLGVALSLLSAIDRRNLTVCDRAAPEPRRPNPLVLEQLHEASRGAPTRGPSSRRKFPVRR